MLSSLPVCSLTLKKPKVIWPPRAKKVMISAPGKGEVKTIVMGVNDSEYDPAKHNIRFQCISTAQRFSSVGHVI